MVVSVDPSLVSTQPSSTTPAPASVVPAHAPSQPQTNSKTPDGRSAFFTDVRNLIHANTGSYVKRLAEAVAVPSVSTDLDKRSSCFAMAELLHGWIQQLGGKSEKVLVGFQELDDGQRFDLPPVILGEFREGPVRNGKPTLLIYGHYDVQTIENLISSSPTSSNTNEQNSSTSTTPTSSFPASWSTDPFVLTERAPGIDDHQINVTSSVSDTSTNSDSNKSTGILNGNVTTTTDSVDKPSAEPTTFTSINEPLEADSVLMGRGVACEKAPLLAWLWGIEAFREVRRELPVNVKFMIEGMQESRSECVQDLIQRETTIRDGFLTNVDYVIVPSGSWSTPARPSLCYGLRGHATFEAEVRTSVTTGNNKPLHSGRWGGALNEPLGDVIHLLNFMQDEIESVPGCGHINQPPDDHINPSERAMYNSIRGDLSELGINIDEEEEEEVTAGAGATGKTAPTSNDDTQVTQAQSRDNVAQVLMRKTCVPAFSIHGIEGGYSGAGVKSVIPNVASGKFSIRFTPLSPQQFSQSQDQPEEGGSTNPTVDQNAAAGSTGIDLTAQIEQTVTQMLRQRFDALDSGNELSITSATTDPWLTSPDSSLIRAGQSALLRSHGFRADLIRDGNSIPVVSMLQNALGTNCQLMLMPMAMAPHDAAMVDESVDKHRYISSIYSAFVLLTELATEHAGRISKEMAAAPPIRKGPLGRLKDIWYGLS